MMGARSRALLGLVSLVLAGGPGAAAHADSPTDSSIQKAQKAGEHFQRGVALYNEADYRAALVEFRRAYDIVPHAAVLYNIGQTFYQLQNYASALSTFVRYLTEADATAPHRQEVEQAIETLKARVGKIEVTTDVPECEILIDDELIGTTPLRGPVLVSIGRRKVTVVRAGRPPETRLVDVAAGDTVKLAVAFAAPTVATPAISPPEPTGALRQARSQGRGIITAGWITTGVLGAGAAGGGVLAYLASRELADARDTFGVSHDDLAKKSSRVRTLSAAADILGVAAVVAGGITLAVTLSRSRSHDMRVAVAPNGIQLAGTFR